jgi:hypothetical protein
MLLAAELKMRVREKGWWNSSWLWVKFASFLAIMRFPYEIFCVLLLIFRLRFS